MPIHQPEARIYDDVATLIPALADALLTCANEALAAHGVFHLVLAGGSTPRALYRELAAREAGDARWHVWYGDERCLPPDDAERNSVMAETAWLASSAIPPDNRRPIPAELGAEAGAARYAEWLQAAPVFDLVLLGMGEDGHTASLFPGHDWGDSDDSLDTLAVTDAPKPPPARVSLSAARLSRSQRVWLLITGAGKRDALARWQQGEVLPVTAVQGRRETCVWLDAAAGWNAAEIKSKD